MIEFIVQRLQMYMPTVNYSSKQSLLFISRILQKPASHFSSYAIGYMHFFCLPNSTQVWYLIL